MPSVGRVEAPSTAVDGIRTIRAIGSVDGPVTDAVPPGATRAAVRPPSSAVRFASDGYLVPNISLHGGMAASQQLSDVPVRLAGVRPVEAIRILGIEDFEPAFLQHRFQEKAVRAELLPEVIVQFLLREFGRVRFR